MSRVDKKEAMETVRLGVFDASPKGEFDDIYDEKTDAVINVFDA